MFAGREKIVERIKSSGYFFKDFTIVEEGDFSVEDADWNFRDLLHIPYWHKVDYTVAMAEENHSTCFWLTKFFGIPLPMMLLAYRPTPKSHSAVTAFFFIVVVSYDTFEEFAPRRSRTTSEYSIGVPSWLKWTLPLIIWYFKKSCKRLVKEDIPIRERRCDLRKWGYSFLSDNLNSGFEKSMNLELKNVIPPRGLPEVNQIELSLNDIFNSGNTYFFGRNDIYGLRLIKENTTIHIFKRMCDHEGMSLDDSICIKNRVRCPVHGKSHRPLASFELNNKGLDSVDSTFHNFVLNNNILHISLKVSCENDLSPV
jgi:hypothetical protein